jgi:hypothetical protein
MVGTCRMQGQMRRAYNIVIRKPEGEIPLGIDDRIILKLILKRLCEGVDRNNLQQNGL